MFYLAKWRVSAAYLTSEDPYYARYHAHYTLQSEAASMLAGNYKATIHIIHYLYPKRKKKYIKKKKECLNHSNNFIEIWRASGLY